MKLVRKLVFYSFVASTVTIVLCSVWYFSFDTSELEAAFPGGSHFVFEKSDQVEIFRLGPTGGDETFLGHSVSARRKIFDPELQRLLKQTIARSLKAEAGIGCTDPGYGIRLADEQSRLDLLFCFETRSLTIRHDNRARTVMFSPAARVIFDQIIDDSPTKSPQ